MWAILALASGLIFFSKSPLVSSLLLATASCGLGAVFLSSYSGWVFYSVMILFGGGMMILFLYICSLTPAPARKLSPSWPLLLAMVSGLACGLFIPSYSPAGSFVENILAPSSMFTLSLLMVFLLTGLVVAVKLANKMDGPLKSPNDPSSC